MFTDYIRSNAEPRRNEKVLALPTLINQKRNVFFIQNAHQSGSKMGETTISLDKIETFVSKKADSEPDNPGNYGFIAS